MTQAQASQRLTRRTALRAASAGAAVAALTSVSRVASAAPRAASTTQVEPDAGGWTTWVLQSGSDLRPAAPDIGATQSGIGALQTFASNRDAAVLDQVSYWDTGSPGFRWN